MGIGKNTILHILNRGDAFPVTKNAIFLTLGTMGTLGKTNHGAPFTCNTDESTKRKKPKVAAKKRCYK